MTPYLTIGARRGLKNYVENTGIWDFTNGAFGIIGKEIEAARSRHFVRS